MYGELMRIEGLTARVNELWEENRRLQSLNDDLVEMWDKRAKRNEALEAEVSELKRDLKEAQKGYRVADMGWGVECSRLYRENERLKKENEAYKDLFTRMRNLVEAVTEDKA